jgi:Mrp family chromosome partitioning ATPase
VPLASGRSLYVLPAGPLPQNPAEVLGSPQMRGLLDSIEKAGADFILIDSPPLLPVADALALSQIVDGVVVLAMAGKTPAGHLAETIDRLRQVNAKIIGVVLDGVPTKGRYSRYYGGYTYGYRDSPSSSRRKRSRPDGADAPAVPSSTGLPPTVDADGSDDPALDLSR